MYQTPTAIWNEIAETQDLRYPEWERLFRMDPDQQMQALDKLQHKLEREDKASTRTILAYTLTAPLLLENVAISKFIQESPRDNLRLSLPELTTIQEAVDLATAEYQLSAKEQRHLRALLREAYPSD